MKFDFHVRTYNVNSIMPQAFRPCGEDDDELLVYFLGYKAQKAEFFSARSFDARVAFVYFELEVAQKQNF